MKFLLLAVCLCVLTTQIYSEETITQFLDGCDAKLNENHANSNGCHKYFDEIKGITSQALDDFKSLTEKQSAILCSLCEFVFESLFNELNGRNAVVTPEDWQKYHEKWGYRENDMAEILRRTENLPADRLDAERKTRLVTFLKATKNKASLDDVKAALTYLYGSA